MRFFALFSYERRRRRSSRIHGSRIDKPEALACCFHPRAVADASFELLPKRCRWLLPGYFYKHGIEPNIEVLFDRIAATRETGVG